MLFLLHIANIARDVSSKTTTSSYVDDTRANCCSNDPQVDCGALQDDLAAIYAWAEDVNMIFNSDKFESLRFWPGNASKPEHPYLSPDNTPIQEKPHLRDPGLEISSDFFFTVPRRGRLIEVARFQSKAPAVVKQARGASLSVLGARIFNHVPRHIRDMATGNPDKFKMELD